MSAMMLQASTVQNIELNGPMIAPRMRSSERSLDGDMSSIHHLIHEIAQENARPSDDISIANIHGQRAPHNPSTSPIPSPVHRRRQSYRQNRRGRVCPSACSWATHTVGAAGTGTRRSRRAACATAGRPGRGAPVRRRRARKTPAGRLCER